MLSISALAAFGLAAFASFPVSEARPIPHSVRLYRRAEVTYPNLKKPPVQWAFEQLEPYVQYHYRYLTVGCAKQHETSYFESCCHPRYAGKTDDDVDFQCTLGAHANTKLAKELVHDPNAAAEAASAASSLRVVQIASVSSVSEASVAAVSSVASASKTPSVAATSSVASASSLASASSVKPTSTVNSASVASASLVSIASEKSASLASDKAEASIEAASAASKAAAVVSGVASSKSEAASAYWASESSVWSAEAASKSSAAAAEAASQASVKSEQEHTYAPAPTSSSEESQPTSDGSGSGSGSSAVDWVTGGVATFFSQNGVAGACGTVHSDSVFLVAERYDRYGNGEDCGRKVEITNQANGKSITATVQDECMGCTNENSLDLSLGAFAAIGDYVTGEYDIKWRFLD